MRINDILSSYGLGQTEASRLLGIPLRTMQDLCSSRRTPAPWILNLIESRLLQHSIDTRSSILIDDDELIISPPVNSTIYIRADWNTVDIAVSSDPGGLVGRAEIVMSNDLPHYSINRQIYLDDINA